LCLDFLDALEAQLQIETHAPVEHRDGAPARLRRNRIAAARNPYQGRTHGIGDATPMRVRQRDAVRIRRRRRIDHQLLDSPGAEHNPQFFDPLVIIDRRYKDRRRQDVTTHGAAGGGIALAGRKHPQQPLVMPLAAAVN
jgi:hypothetical protein